MVVKIQAQALNILTLQVIAFNNRVLFKFQDIIRMMIKYSL
jgi:hypothetical protein